MKAGILLRVHLSSLLQITSNNGPPTYPVRLQDLPLSLVHTWEMKAGILLRVHLSNLMRITSNNGPPTYPVRLQDLPLSLQLPFQMGKNW